MNKKKLDHHESLTNSYEYSKMGVKRIFPLHHDYNYPIDAVEFEFHHVFGVTPSPHPGVCLSDAIICIGFAISACTILWLLSYSNL